VREEVNPDLVLDVCVIFVQAVKIEMKKMKKYLKEINIKYYKDIKVE